MRRSLSAVFSALLVVALLVVPALPASAESPPADPLEAAAAGGTWSGSVSDAVRTLSTRTEHAAGYDRGKFSHWIDADGDCQDTRAEVLIDESTSAAVGGCTIRTGAWTSYYDDVKTTTASALDIDHSYLWPRPGVPEPTRGTRTLASDSPTTSDPAARSSP